MQLRGSVELHQPALAGYDIARKVVDPKVQAAFENFKDILPDDVTFLYVPIIMPVGMRELYPARSKVRRKARAIDCSPQLEYNIFVALDPTQMIEEYLRGMITGATLLPKLGFSDRQIKVFLDICLSVGREVADVRL